MRSLGSGQMRPNNSRMRQRVLIVEDEPGLVMTITDRLENEGYSVESTGDGDTGLELILFT